MTSKTPYVIGACLLGAGLMVGMVLGHSDPHAVAKGSAAAVRARIYSADIISPSPAQELKAAPASTSAFDPGLEPKNYFFLTMMAALAIAWSVRKKQTVDIFALAAANGTVVVNPRVDRTAAIMSGASSRPSAAAVPRHLLKNPYGTGFHHLTFDEQVKIAIEASLRSARVIGVIHFTFPTTSKGELVRSDENPRPDIRVVADRFRSRLRQTDCVRLLAKNEIAVFISLLSNVTDLESIATRLSYVAKESGFSLGTGLQDRPGLAMYPLDGYTGTDLISAAKNHAASLDVLALNAPDSEAA